MKITDILNETGPGATSTDDYQKMLSFAKANQMPGVPPEQQIALALFKEIQKQRQQNQELGAELNAAEKRIDVATQRSDITGQEVGKHRDELGRERKDIEAQKAGLGKLDQEYSARAQASQEQIDNLTSRLESIKNQPGINKDAADALEKQIQALDKKGVSMDKFQELEQTINRVQRLQHVDDEVVQGLAAQVKDAHNTAKELAKTKQDMSHELDKEAVAAQDKIDELTREIDELRALAATVQPAITDVIQPKLQQIDQKVKELDGENEHIYTELGQHDLEIRKLGGSGGSGTPEEPEPPVNPAPAPIPGNPNQDAEDAADAKAKAAIAKAQLNSLKQPQQVAESKFFKSVAWATGKTK